MFVLQLWRKSRDISPKLRDQILNGELGFEVPTPRTPPGENSLVPRSDPTLSRGGARGVGTRLRFSSVLVKGWGLGTRLWPGSGDETVAGVSCGRGLVWPGSRVAGVCLAFCVSLCCRGLVCRGFLCVGGLYRQSVVRPSGGGRFQRAPVIKSFVSSGLHATFLG